MLRVCHLSSIVQFVECNILLFITSASDLPLHTNKFCSVVFSSSWSSMMVVINIGLLMRGGVCSKLHRGRSQLLFALQQSSIDSQLFVENRDLCLPYLHPTPPLGWSPSEYCRDVWCENCCLPDVEKNLKIRLLV